MQDPQPSGHGAPMPEDISKKAQDVIARLRERGHNAQADHLASRLAGEAEYGLLFALREACLTVLTAIEAIDPVSQTMIEELRLAVDKHLKPHT
jgi:hypothetical protein